MAVAQGYGKTVTSGSVFAYDTGDTVNSYKGKPTTNRFSTEITDPTLDSLARLGLLYFNFHNDAENFYGIMRGQIYQVE